MEGLIRCGWLYFYGVRFDGSTGSFQIFLCFPQIFRGIYDLNHCGEDNGQCMEKPFIPDKLDTFFHQFGNDSAG